MQNCKIKQKSLSQQIEDFKNKLRKQGYKVTVIVEDNEENR